MTTALDERVPRTVELRGRLVRILPILGWLPTYRRAWLGRDLVAGLVIVCLFVPEGMAYAQIAGMPPETAFYVAPPALLLYALFASSRKLVVVVSATQATLSASAVAPLAAPGTVEYAELTAALALLVGLISIAAGALRLGFVARFFSPSVLTGFVTGLVLVVGIKQVPKMLGIASGDGNFFERLWDILVNLGNVHGATLLMSTITIVAMLAVERFVPRVPAALVALVTGIALSQLFDLATRGVEVIEEIPSGLAAPELPAVSFDDITLLSAAAVGIFLVNFAEANSIGRELARRDRAEVDANAELVGLGAANAGAGLFQGFTIGASLSKSAAASRAGMQTQMAGIAAAGGVVLVALFLTGLFAGLPEATLGAIVVVAIRGMVKGRELRRLHTVRRTDFLLAATALLGVLTLETLSALVLAVSISIVLLVYRAATAAVRPLGRLPDGAYDDVRAYPEAVVNPAVPVVRPDAELFFANAESVAEEIMREVSAIDPPPRGLVLDLESTSDMDIPAADALANLAQALSDDGVQILLARVQPPVLELLERTGALGVVGRENVFHRAADAVAAIDRQSA